MIWIVKSQNADLSWLNMTQTFCDEQAALTEAKRLSQNPDTSVEVTEPSGETWTL